MNTGTRLETARLWLVPGLNSRDSEPFLKMLRSDGDLDFHNFSGVDFSERYLKEFSDYFEHPEGCIYSIYPKGKDTFMGYVGFHREKNNYEIEFYVSKAHRCNGYCVEACVAVMNLIFTEGISVDGVSVTVDKLYATTITDNIPTVRLLEKIGFKRDIPKDGPIFIMQAFVDEEDGAFFGNCVSKYVIEKGDYISDT